MNPEIGGSLTFLLVGGVIGIVTALRFRSDKSYISKPAMQVSRKDDPFSYWLSLAVPAGVSVPLVIVGLFGLVRGYWH